MTDLPPDSTPTPRETPAARRAVSRAEELATMARELDDAERMRWLDRLDDEAKRLLVVAYWQILTERNAPPTGGE